MSTCLSTPSIIERVSDQVGEYSYKQKTEPFIREDKVNYFLDKMLVLRQILHGQTDELRDLIELADQVTWIDNLNEDQLKKINEIIAGLKDLYTSLCRQVALLRPIKSKGIETTAINEFRCEVEAIRELYQDYESKYFYLPQIEEFVESEKIISLL